MIESYKVIPNGPDACALVVKCIGQANTKSMKLPVAAERIIEFFWSLDKVERPLIQNAFPDLDATQREFLKNGTTQEEWDAMFGPEE